MHPSEPESLALLVNVRHAIAKNLFYLFADEEYFPAFVGLPDDFGHVLNETTMLFFPMTQVLFCSLALADVGDNPADCVYVPSRIEEGKLVDDARVQAIGLLGDFLKFDWNAHLEHLEIVGAESEGLFAREDLLVLPAFDVFLAHPKSLFELPVDEQVSSVNIFEKDHVRTIVQKRLKLLVAFPQRRFHALALA